MTTTEDEGRSRIDIGVDPLRTGLNPYLVGDTSSFLDDLSKLVFPRTFVGGELNDELLDWAGPVEPSEGAAQTLVYDINDSAQWSDGTPITGADFVFLWRTLSATNGVRSAAGYQQITDVRVSEGGRRVEVDLASKVAEWRRLFSPLLPSHVVSSGSFSTAMDEEIPASAGKFLVAHADPKRGAIELNRNDRYWGDEPAKTEIIGFQEVGDGVDGLDQVRNTQLSFVNIAPGQTTEDAYRLVDGAQTRTINTGRMLTLSASTASPVVGDAAARRELRELIDVPEVAKLATGRTEDLALPAGANRTSERAAGADPEALRGAASVERPLTIAADPRHPEAARAARAIVDLAAAKGIPAAVSSVDFTEAVEDLLPAGEVDAVLSWGVASPTALDVASAYSCPTPEQRRLEAKSRDEETGEGDEGDDEEAAAADGWGSNLTGYCDEDTQQRLMAALAGDMGDEELAAFVAGLEDEEALYTPIVGEQRLEVARDELHGPAEDLKDWPDGVGTAGEWELDEEFLNNRAILRKEQEPD